MTDRLNSYFYDIESLTNAFTLSCYRPDDERVDIYYLVDDPGLTGQDSIPFKKMAAGEIRAKNQNFRGDIYYLNLHEQTANERLAQAFGLSDARYVNDPEAKSSFPAAFRPTCDTDPDYSPEKAPYFFGYNSTNYDLTMLAYYFTRTWRPNASGVRDQFRPITAKEMRDFNDTLFSRYIGQMPASLWEDKTASLVLKNFRMTGRHLDVSQLNERQRRVGLKRLLGNLGWQILESDKLRPGQDYLTSQEEFADLIAYNVSDVVNLKELFCHPYYQGQFLLKKGLLDRYPDLVYQEDGDSYKPKIGPKFVRYDRLTIDSTSAAFARKVLCPYGRLKDDREVSFLYPAKAIAEKTGEKQRDVLEEAKDFFYKMFDDEQLRANFDRVYDYYKQFAGKNFNPSKEYKENYGDQALPVSDFSQVDKEDTNLFYYQADGTPSSCYITFSVGGLHGSEYNLDLFKKDDAEFQKKAADLAYVKKLYPDPLELRQSKEVILPDGRVESYKSFLTSKATIKAMEKTPVAERGQFYKDFAKAEPSVFKDQAGSTRLDPRYGYTSSCLTNHEDFTSYYPNMLRRLNAFYNERLGEDRYSAIFERKQELDVKRKDENYSPAQRQMFEIEREGTKLILNSATGAADPRDERVTSVIRMNNRIRSMRIIGQLFTYMIGQAQTYAGARIVSTNTDGLYSVLDKETNDRILAKEAAEIGVEIEPEELYLISKDSNNRMEATEDGQILSASGSLACYQDTTPVKSLAHPAIIDWLLSQYLLAEKADLSAPFDREKAKEILDRVPYAFPDLAHRLRMFQNILASNFSKSKTSCVFGYEKGKTLKPISLQRYNRVFIYQDGLPLTLHLYLASAKKLTPAMKKKREKNGEPALQHDALAMFVLNACGLKRLAPGREAAVSKIPGLDPAWSMHVENRAINLLDPAEQEAILNSLDYDKYLDLAEAAYENNWRNLT